MEEPGAGHDAMWRRWGGWRVPGRAQCAVRTAGPALLRFWPPGPPSGGAPPPYVVHRCGRGEHAGAGGAAEGEGAPRGAPPRQTPRARPPTPSDRGHRPGLHESGAAGGRSPQRRGARPGEGWGAGPGRGARQDGHAAPRPPPPFTAQEDATAHLVPIILLGDPGRADGLVGRTLGGGGGAPCRKMGSPANAHTSPSPPHPAVPSPPAQGRQDDGRPWLGDRRAPHRRPPAHAGRRPLGA